MGRIGAGGGSGGSCGIAATAQRRSLPLEAVAAAAAAIVLSIACGRIALRRVRPPRPTDVDNVNSDARGDEALDGEGIEEIEESLSKPDEESKRKRRTTLEEEMQSNGGRLTVQPIGVVRSVYRLCVGTPRQGLLAPHARGRIELSVPTDAVDGLQEYSHIWIVFVFHLNTLTINPQKRPAKITPPALGGGKKVGVLSTRSPHRYNPIGITLAKLDRIEGCVLHLSGIDLVDGTPVVDVKPFNPSYDAPPLSQHPVRVPSWVESGLVARRVVTFTDEALTQLQDIVATPKDDKGKRQHALDFYRDDDDATNLSNITSCIQEVLSMDVRSSFQANKARRGQYQVMRAQRLGAAPPSEATMNAAIASTAPVPTNLKDTEVSSNADLKDGYIDNEGKPTAIGSDPDLPADLDATVVSTQQLDNLLVRYVIAPPDSVPNKGPSLDNGAEDRVTVVSVEYLESYDATRK